MTCTASSEKIDLESALRIAIQEENANVPEIVSIIGQLKAQGSTAADQTVITWAIQNQNTDLLEKLLELGADPRSKTTEGKTYLWLAAMYRFPEGIRILFEHGRLTSYDLNVPCKRGKTPLIIAVVHANYISTKRLLEHGADPNKGSGNQEPLYEPVMGDDNDPYRFPYESLLLFNAILKQRYDFVELLLSYGARCNLSVNGYTPMHLSQQLSRTSFMMIRSSFQDQPRVSRMLIREAMEILYLLLPKCDQE